MEEEDEEKEEDEEWEDVEEDDEEDDDEDLGLGEIESDSDVAGPSKPLFGQEKATTELPKPSSQRLKHIIRQDEEEGSDQEHKTRLSAAVPRLKIYENVVSSIADVVDLFETSGVKNLDAHKLFPPPRIGQIMLALSNAAAIYSEEGRTYSPTKSEKAFIAATQDTFAAVPPEKKEATIDFILWNYFGIRWACHFWQKMLAVAYMSQLCGVSQQMLASWVKVTTENKALFVDMLELIARGKISEVKGPALADAKVEDLVKYPEKWYEYITARKTNRVERSRNLIQAIQKHYVQIIMLKRRTGERQLFMPLLHEGNNLIEILETILTPIEDSSSAVANAVRERTILQIVQRLYYIRTATERGFAVASEFNRLVKEDPPAPTKDLKALVEKAKKKAVSAPILTQKQFQKLVHNPLVSAATPKTFSITSVRRGRGGRSSFPAPPNGGGRRPQTHPPY